MTPTDFPKSKTERRHELRQIKDEALSALESKLVLASRANVQAILRLPDKIRTDQIKGNTNYRRWIRDLLREKSQKPELNAKAKELMEEVAAKIDDVDRIIKEIDDFDGPENSDRESGEGKLSDSGAFDQITEPKSNAA